jgi:hypothetical protein
MFINMFILWVVFISFFVHFYDKGPDYWWTKWSLLFFGLTVVLARQLWKRVHWSVGLGWGWLALSAVYTFSWFTGRYENWPPNDFMILAYYSSVAFICLVLFANFLLYLKNEHLLKLRYMFMFLCIADSIFVLVQYLLGYSYTNRGGMFGNGSINGNFIAFTYPLVMEYAFKGFSKEFRTNLTPIRLITYAVLLLPVLACVATEASNPIGAMAISIGAFIFFKIKGKLKYILSSISVTIIIIIGCLTQTAATLFNSSNRFDLYRINFIEWLLRGNIFTGDGTGTFPMFGIASQIKHQVMVGSWAIWLHNDWLQILIESGIIGLGIALLFSIVFIIKLWNRPYLLACLLSFMGSMVFNYPVHYSVHALFLVYLIAEAFKGNTPKTNQDAL